MLAIEKKAALEAANARPDRYAKPTRDAPSRWLRIGAAVGYSGIGRTTLYELMNAGSIKSFRVKGIRLIDRESLDAFIEAQLVTTV